VEEPAEPSDESNLFLDDFLLVEVLVNLLHVHALLHVLVLGQLVVSAPQQNLHHRSDVLGQKGHAPVEHVHHVREDLGFLAFALLLDFDVGALEFQDCALVALVAALVGRREDGDDLGEDFVVVLQLELVELEAVELGFMGADQGVELMVFQKLSSDCLPVLVRTAAHVIGSPAIDVTWLVVFNHALFLVRLLVDGVAPEDVAEQPLLRGLGLAVQLHDLVERHFGRNPAVNDQELVE